MTASSARQWDDVADLLGSDFVPPMRDMDDADEARRRIGEYLVARLRSVLDAYPGRPTLMLSGGIDSTTLAGALKEIRANPLCVTVAVADRLSADHERAAAVAACLGFEHVAVEVSREEAVAAAVDVAQDLGTDEIWEVGAAVTIRLAVGVAGGGGGGGTHRNWRRCPVRWRFLANCAHAFQHGASRASQTHLAGSPAGIYRPPACS